MNFSAYSRTALVAAASLAFLAAAPVAFASSHIDSVVVGAQNPSQVIISNAATYPVSFTSHGSGADPVALSVTSVLPTGASASFSPNPVDVTGSSALTVGTTDSTPPGTYTLTIQAVADATKTATASFVVVGKEDQTVTVTVHAPASATYGDTFLVAATASSGLDVAITATGGCSIPGGTVNGGTVTMTSGTTACVVHYNQAGNGSYSAAPEVTETATAIKATPTISVTNSPQTYTGSGQSAAVSAGPVAGVVSNVLAGGAATQTEAGTYVVTADFAPADTADYNSLAGASAGNFVISQASSDTVVTCPASEAYNGSAQTPCTVAVTGAGGLSQTPDANYTANTDVGTVNASYTFAGDADHTGSSDAKTFDITPAPLTIVGMTAASQEYDGSTVVADISSSGTLSGVLNSDDVAIDTATGAYTFADPHAGNAKPVTVSGVTLSGSKAGDYSLTQPTDVTVDVTPRPITVTADALGKTYGNPDPTLTYGVAGTLVAPDEFTGALARAAGEDVGTYAINQGTLALTSNYEITYIPAQFSISAKDFLTVTADDQSSTYGEADPIFTFQYSGFVNGDDEDAVGTAPTCSVSGAHADAGAYTIECSGGSAANYDFSYVSGELTVKRADADISVSPYDVTYDGNAHTASATATGVGGADLSAGLDLSGTTHIDAGNYAEDSWSFDGGTNYKSVTATTIADAIGKADATIVVTPYNVQFDGESHTAIGSATGVGDDGSLEGLDLSHTTHTDIGTYSEDSWSFAGGANYNPGEGTITDTISALPVFTLSYAAGAHGSITGTSSQSVEQGSDGTAVTAVADSGFHFVSWSDSSTANPRTDTNVTGDISVSATFAADTSPNPPSNNGNSGGGSILAGAGGSNPLPGQVQAVGNIPTGGNSGGQVLGAAVFNFTKNLRYRLVDPDVAQLQQFLVTEGYSIPDGITRYFGPQTLAAVRAFQKANDIPVTGYVGPLTRAVLNRGIVPTKPG